MIFLVYNGEAEFEHLTHKMSRAPRGVARAYEEEEEKLEYRGPPIKGDCVPISCCLLLLRAADVLERGGCREHLRGAEGCLHTHTTLLMM